jgi:hypothetical protein
VFAAKPAPTTFSVRIFRDAQGSGSIDLPIV